RSESHMSWWTCWKYHFILPVCRSRATIEHVYRFVPAPREFHGSGLPVPTKSSPSFWLMIGDSQNAPPPNAVLPLPFLFDQVLKPGWPCCGVGLKPQPRGPLAAVKAVRFGLGPPLSPAPSPTMTKPST